MQIRFGNNEKQSYSPPEVLSEKAEVRKSQPKPPATFSLTPSASTVSSRRPSVSLDRDEFQRDLRGHLKSLIEAVAV